MHIHEALRVHLLIKHFGKNPWKKVSTYQNSHSSVMYPLDLRMSIAPKNLGLVNFSSQIQERMSFNLHSYPFIMDSLCEGAIKICLGYKTMIGFDHFKQVGSYFSSFYRW